MEILDKVYETKLCSPDNWGYIVKVFEDTTELWFYELNDPPGLIGNLTSGYDIQVAEEIIRLRKVKIAEG